MSKPKQFNSIQPQVVQSDGRFFPQFSTDGLNFFPIGYVRGTIEDAIEDCELWMAQAECLVERGKVVWRSDE